MALRRKIEQELLNWKQDPDRLPLVIKGLRQCGKTYSTLQFAKQNYKSVIYLNFFEQPDYSKIFAGALNVDQITLLISALYGQPVKFIPGNTVIILDEIQECPQARTALKFFKIDGRYDVIATGSLLGVNGYGENATSIPVGYESTLKMQPLDFEEFLWANNISDAVINLLRNCLQTETPVPEALHQRMEELFLQYAVVGGMPTIVNDFIRNHNISTVRRKQQDLLNSYRSDMTKYAANSDKNRIVECFDSIPRQLGKDNKKFQYSVVRKGGRSNQYTGSLQWIEDAGLVRRCRNVTITELPLEGFSSPDVFKVYLADTGLFIGMLSDGIAAKVLTGELDSYKGAIFENLAADVLGKMNRPLFYFQKSSGLEIDFLIQYKGQCVLLEVKSTSGNIKSAKTILKHPEKYHVESAIKVGRYNIGRNDQILTLPFYLLFLLTDI